MLHMNRLVLYMLVCLFPATGLGRLGKLGKRGHIIDCQISQHLTVDLDAGLVQAVHHAAVAYAIDPRRGIDTRDPQAPEIALP